MSLKLSSLLTCLGGWLILAGSLLLTRYVPTDKWSVVIPLTAHLFGYMMLAASVVLSVLWMVYLGRWQEDFGVAILTFFLAGAPVAWLAWTFTHQSKGFTQFALRLMWTGP